MATTTSSSVPQGTSSLDYYMQEAAEAIVSLMTLQSKNTQMQNQFSSQTVQVSEDLAQNAATNAQKIAAAIEAQQHQSFFSKLFGEIAGALITLLGVITADPAMAIIGATMLVMQVSGGQDALNSALSGLPSWAQPLIMTALAVGLSLGMAGATTLIEAFATQAEEMGEEAAANGLAQAGGGAGGGGIAVGDAPILDNPEILDDAVAGGADAAAGGGNGAAGAGAGGGNGAAGAGAGGGNGAAGADAAAGGGNGAAGADAAAGGGNGAAGADAAAGNGGAGGQAAGGNGVADADGAGGNNANPAAGNNGDVADAGDPQGDLEIEEDIVDDANNDASSSGKSAWGTALSYFAQSTFIFNPFTSPLEKLFEKMGMSSELAGIIAQALSMLLSMGGAVAGSMLSSGKGLGQLMQNFLNKVRSGGTTLLQGTLLLSTTAMSTTSSVYNIEAGVSQLTAAKYLKTKADIDGAQAIYQVILGLITQITNQSQGNFQGTMDMFESMNQNWLGYISPTNTAEFMAV